MPLQQHELSAQLSELALLWEELYPFVKTARKRHDLEFLVFARTEGLELHGRVYGIGMGTFERDDRMTAHPIAP